MGTLTNGDGIAMHVRGTADAVGQLLAGHLKLARLELVNDASLIGRRAVFVGAFAFVGAVGYVFFALGAAELLWHVWGWAPALLFLGALQVLGGGFGAFLTMRRLRSVEVFDRTAHAARHSMAMVHTKREEKLVA